MATIYINGVSGSDSFDGSSPTVGSSNVGPKKSIIGGVNASQSGGIISIAAGTYQGDNNKNITLEMNLTITGAGINNTTLDAQDDDLFFAIEDKYTVSIQGITFTNGKSRGTVKGSDGDCGGAIYNKGNLIVQSCSFTHNRAGNGNNATTTDNAGHGGNGGAIWNVGTLTMTDCELSDNKAGDGGEGHSGKDGHKGGSGGAIMNDGSLTLNNCILKNNYTGAGGDGGNQGSMPGLAGRGGAVFCNGSVTIHGGEICGNYTAMGGETSFEMNCNGSDAGALYNCGTMQILSQCNIHDNYTSDGRDTGKHLKDAGNGGNGGAISNEGTLSIDGCTLTNNHTGSGGDGYDKSDEQGFGVGKGGNGGFGGAIYNNSTLTITNSAITNNKAGNAGYGGQSTLDYNAENGGTGGHGGAIYNDFLGVLKIEGTSASLAAINHNTAGNGGKGGLGRRCYDQYTGFSGDPGDGGAGGYGGAICNIGTIQSIAYTQFDSNTAGTGGEAGSFKTTDGVAGKVDPGTGGNGGSGGGIYSSGALNRLDCVLITNNRAGAGGNGNTCSMNDSGDGASGGYGGGIYSSVSFDLSNSTVSNNQAGNGGSGGNVKINGNLPSDDCGNGGNGGQGGGISLHIVNNIPLIFNTVYCIFNSNIAGIGGNGGIDDYSGSKSSDGGNGGGGGGIYFTNPTSDGNISISLTQTTMSWNCTGNGGNKYNQGTNGTQGQGGGISLSGSYNPLNSFTMCLCRTIYNQPQAVYYGIYLYDFTRVSIQNNWWGSNDNPQSQLAGNLMTQCYTPWLVAGLSALPDTIVVSQSAKIKLDLTKNSNGGDTYAAYNKYLQNGVPVSFRCDGNYGYINPTDCNLAGGTTYTVYAAKAAGTDSVFATVDSQSLSTSITVS